MQETNQISNGSRAVAVAVSAASPWITIEQLQQRYGVGRSAAYAWAHRLPNDVCVRIGAKKLLINERKLIAYLEQKGARIVPRPSGVRGGRR
jgi:hypothetical protein